MVGALLAALVLSQADVPAETFPEKLGTMIFGETKNCGGGCGVSVAYDPEDRAVACTLFLYDDNQVDIGTGLTPKVETEYANVHAALKQHGGSGFRDSTFKVVVKPAPIAFKVTSFDYRIDDKEPVASFFAITGYHGKFVKVRCTERQGGPSRLDKDAKAFTSAVALRIGDLLKPR